MQNKVAPSDHAFPRNHNGKIQEYEYTRHIFGATFSQFIVFYALRRSARENQEKFSQELPFIELNVFNDDLYISTANVENVVTIMNSTKESLSLGGFNLTKWNSNSDDFLKNVAIENLLKPDMPSPQPEKNVDSAWYASTDGYVFEKKLVKNSPMNNSQSRGNF